MRVNHFTSSLRVAGIFTRNRCKTFTHVDTVHNGVGLGAPNANVAHLQARYRRDNGSRFLRHPGSKNSSGRLECLRDRRDTTRRDLAPLPAGRHGARGSWFFEWKDTSVPYLFKVQASKHALINRTKYLVRRWRTFALPRKMTPSLDMSSISTPTCPVSEAVEGSGWQQACVNALLVGL